MYGIISKEDMSKDVIVRTASFAEPNISASFSNVPRFSVTLPSGKINI
ncbi:DUF2627 domain-containing protein [Tatumella citrea]